MFRHFKEKLRRTASLLPTLHKRSPSYRGNAAITILRIFLWLIPALFIPLVALLGGVLSRYLPTPANVSLMLFLMVAATAGIGLFEEAHRFQQMRVPLANAERASVSSTVFFVLLQIIIAPVVCLGVILLMGAF